MNDLEREYTHSDLPEDQLGENSEANLEQRRIADAALVFSDYVTSRWPQAGVPKRIQVAIDDSGRKINLPDFPPQMKREPQLNYFFCGSLAAMLLSKADSIASLDESRLPSLEIDKSIPMSEKAKEIYTAFSRPIGDLDFVPSESYSQDENRLRAGGGGPSYGEIPQAALPAIKPPEPGQIKMECDPVLNYGVNSVVMINLGGRIYYVASPDSMVGYKALHALESYKKNPTKINHDFKRLLDAAREIYKEENLIRTTRKIFDDYERRLQKTKGSEDRVINPMVEEILKDVESPRELREFLVEVMQKEDHPIDG